MKRFTFIIVLLLATAAWQHLSAQEVNFYEYTSVTDNYGSDNDLRGVLRVSDNGKYLVGSTGVAWPYYLSYTVDMETKELTYLNSKNGAIKNFLYLQDISDEGITVGAYTVPDVTTDGSDYNCWTPCVMFPDGEKVSLPLPASMDNSDYKEVYCAADGYQDVFYVPQALRVSPDCRVVMGQMMVPDTVVRDGEEHHLTCFEPVLWTFDPDSRECLSVEQIKLPYESVNGFIPYDMTDDGSIIVGRWTDEDGDAEPVMAYTDDDGWHIMLLRTAQGDTFWSGGAASCIDNDGNIYYVYPDDYAYYDDDGNPIVYSAKYNIYSGETTEYGLGVVVCGANGLVVGMEVAGYGPCVVFEGDMSLDLSQLIRVENISDDGTVIAGAGIIYTDAGDVNNPAFLTISYDVLEPDPEPDPDGIQTIAADGESTEIYTIMGQKTAVPVKGVNIINGKKVIIK